MTLKDLRLKSGLKQQKIFEELGISRSGLYFIEIGKTKPDKLKIERLSSIYNCSEKEILEAWEAR
jgi:transcriptional regulator with XRE-family HTH domain